MDPMEEKAEQVLQLRQGQTAWLQCSVDPTAIATSDKEDEGLAQLEQVVTQEADSLQIQPDDEKKDDEEIAALPPVLNVSETCWGGRVDSELHR